MLNILLLGTPQILRAGAPLNITRKKSRALIYYLAASQKPLTRDHLLSFFWPDADRAAAQQILRTTLHGLRQALNSDLIVDDNTIALASDVVVDAKLFEKNLQHPTSNLQSLTATLQLYRADFLTDFTLNDSAAFDEWTIGQQEYYRRLAVRGYIALAQQHEARQEFNAALEALERALTFDPLQEDIQRTALHLHYQAGDRAGAIRRYEHFRKLLDAEMGVPPMAETRAMYDAIINDKLPAASKIRPLPPAARLPQSIPFTGRLHELKMLQQLSAAHQLAVIEGEPGIGKTRLIEEFLASANAIRLIGAARELEHALPYQPIIEALRALVATPEWPALQAGLNLPDVWLKETARLLPELTETPSVRSITPIDRNVIETNVNDESILWEGLHLFLTALSRQHRVIFFIDDLHWADASTLGLLGYLVRGSRTSNAPIFFVATARPTDARSAVAVLLQALSREGSLTHIGLQRLPAEDVTALARQLSPKYGDILARWLTDTAEGNPYIMAELIRHLRETDLLKADGSLNVYNLSATPIVPPTVYSLIQSRLAKLSDAARRVLDVAVAIGRDFDFDIAARAAALSENAALDAIDELRWAGLILPKGLNGSQFTFDHSLTMEVAYREVGEPRHRLLHRRVAESLENLNRGHLDSVAGILAWHFGEGNDPQHAAPYALRAAQQAVQIAAWQEAIAFYQQALQADINPAERESIEMLLGEAYIRTNQLAQATEAYRTALNIAEQRGGDAVAPRLALGRSMIVQSRFAEAITLAQQVLQTGEAEHAAKAELLWGSVLSIEGADLIGAAEHLNFARELLAGQNDPVRLAQINFEQGNVAAQLGDLPRAIELYRATIDIADQSDESAIVWRILGRNNLAYHLLLQGDPGAVDYASEGMKIAQEHGVLFFQPFLFSTLGEISLAHNDLDKAEKYFTDGLALAERTSSPERIIGLTANLGLVATARGDTTLAIHRLSTALARADALGTQHLAAQIRLWLIPLLPAHEARAYLAEVHAIAGASGRKRLLAEADRLEQRLNYSLPPKAGD